MTTQIRRELVIDVPSAALSQHLARIAHWLSWATQATHIALASTGTFTPVANVSLLMACTTCNPLHIINPALHWQWRSIWLGFTMRSTHYLEAINERQTRLVIEVTAEGLGSAFFGRLFAAIYNYQVRAAMPKLVADLRAFA